MFHILKIGIAFLLALTSVNGMTYKQLDKSSYYVPEGVQNIFDTKLEDIANPLGWVYYFKNFTVLKDGFYYQTPNLQMLSKNLVSQGLAQGFSFQPSEKEPLSSGRLQLEHPIYLGEYPLTLMSTNQILPSNFLDGLWRGLKALFGASFVDAPNANTLNSITSLNADYKDRESQLVEKIRDALVIFTKNLETQWNGGAKGFKRDYISPETKERAEAENKSVKFGDKYGEEAYKAAKTKLTDYEGGKFSYKTFDGLINGEEGYSFNKAAKQQYINWLEKREDKEELVKLSPNEVYEKFKNELPQPSKFIYPENEVFKENEDISIIKKYEGNLSIIEKYNNFIDLFNKTGKDSYSQCLIKSEKNGACSDSKYGSPSTFAIGNVHVLSGAFEKTIHKETLSDSDVLLYLQKIRSYTGPYYQEVLGNLLQIINNHYKSATNTELDLDQKVMRPLPYDKWSLTGKDKDSFETTDPRNDIFREHPLGNVVSNGLLTNLNFLFYFKISPMLVDFTGVVVDFTVLLNSIVSFKILDNMGLSPANLWDNAFITIIIALSAIWMIWETVKYAIKMVTQGASFVSYLRTFLLFILEIGILFLMATNPKGTWNRISNSFDTIMNLGERIVTLQENTLDYLTPKPSDIYLLPYYDSWSYYHTGYDLNDSENVINLESGQPEVKDLVLPKINDLPIKHWSMLLADSFRYEGDSTSIKAIEKDGKYINGPSMNLNAYRAVDHFMAPRVRISDVEGGKTLTVTANENYNNKFQKSFFELFPKLFTSFILFILTFVKVMTFFWFWFNLYTLFYQLFMIKVKERSKSWIQVLGRIFAPLVHIIFIGLLSGFTIQLMMHISDAFFGTLLMFGYLLVLRGIFLWWSKMKSFPGTLRFFVYLLEKGDKQDGQQEKVIDS